MLPRLLRRLAHDAMVAGAGLTLRTGWRQSRHERVNRPGSSEASGGVGDVGGHLGAVQGDHAKADHAGGFAQLERSDQEVGQGLLVADAEAGDGHMVRGLAALALRGSPRPRPAQPGRHPAIPQN